MAMLLPASFGASRRMNDSHDIRKNLRFRNAELAQEHPEGSTNEWGYKISPTVLAYKHKSMPMFVLKLDFENGANMLQ